MSQEIPGRSGPLFAELRYLDTNEPSEPADLDDFAIGVQAPIGPRGHPGEEVFYFTVCTPSWLQQRLTADKFIFGAHKLIVARFDWGTIEEAIRDLCRRVSGSTWEEVANKLSGFLQWEFEDYRNAN